MQYTTGEEERVRCYANNAYNSVGGTHLSGFRTALTRALNTYGNKENLFKNDHADRRGLPRGPDRHRQRRRCPSRSSSRRPRSA